ncbi:hypothetical protein PYW07_009073 [Mythimna separata]|uniref:RNA-directed DNA polymerase from mobile element jockey n=1 Tax=Mythimna separata TaxID=271217 RepID=A0AAD7YAY2_MYTSE|nr:hypothetical protein PYW07_009073 [Mythimna separata]
MDSDDGHRHMKINILQWNAQSLRPKITDFQALLHQEKIHIAILSETWFDPDSACRLSGYHIFRADRDDGYGGTAVFIHNSIKAIQCNVNISNSQIQIIHIKLLNCSHLENIISIYCPSSVRTRRSDWDEIFSITHHKTIIAGDMNGHHSNWSSRTDSRGNQIFDSVMDNNLCTLNDNSHTRLKLVNGAIQKSSPDITIVSTELALNISWRVMNENLGSDHLMIKICVENHNTINLKRRRNYKKADWQGYTQKIESDFSNFNSPPDHQASYNKFIDIINSAADQYIPMIKTNNNPLQANKFRPKPYWNNSLSHIVAQRRLALATFRRNPNPHNLEILQNKVSEAQKRIRQAKNKSYQEFCNSIDSVTSSSEMWRRMRWVKGYKAPASFVDKEKAESLLRSLTPDYVTPPAPTFTSCNTQLSNPVSVQEVINLIKNTDSAPGHDNISYSMLRHLPYNAKTVLTSIYNNILLSAFVPEQWKKVKIIPVPKPGIDSGLNSGVRPIALISCLCKVLHTIITRRLEWFLEKNELLSQDTTGFRRSKSCYDGLSRLVARVETGFSKKNPTVGCFIDVENAYNNVSVTSLLGILDNLGIGYVLCNYLWQYLHRRYLFVELHDNSLICRHSGVGIAQGDPLSPLLFNAATITVCRSISNVFISQYADDFVIYDTQKRLSDSVSHIQNALHIFQNIMKDLGLNISQKKTKVCLFSRGRRNTKIHLFVNDSLIDQVDCIKYLGMWLDSSLKWGKHINEIREKICRYLNIFKVLSGGKWGIHPSHLRRLYIAIIRSRMDYGCFLYGRCANGHLLKLDRVQNQAMRIMGGFIRSTPIHTMESELCLQPLFIRRLFLTGKFYLRSKSVRNNIIISILEELSNQCHGPYWRNKKLPLLIDVHREYSEKPLHSSSILDIYSLDTWVTNVDLCGVVEVKIDGVSGAKRLINVTDLNNTCVNMIVNKFSEHYKIFTDGSKDGSDLGAAYFDPQCDTKAKFKINSKISIMYCELIAISEALLYLLTINHDHFVIFSDSKSSLQHLARVPSSLRGCPIAITILDLICKFKSLNKSITIQWIPSHVGIMGNEVADLAARQASYEGIDYSCLPLYSDWLGYVKDMCRHNWHEYFNERSKMKGIWYKTIQSEPLRYPWFEGMEIDRRHVVALLRMRSGHIPSNKFKYLMGKSSSPNCETCGVIEDIYHVLMECDRNIQERQGLPALGSEIGACNSILASPLSEGAKILCRLLWMCE